MISNVISMVIIEYQLMHKNIKVNLERYNLFYEMII